MGTTLSYRVFDIEAAVAGLADDLETCGDLTENELLRVYVLREKLDRIIAGDDRQVYDIAYKKRYNDRERKIV